MQKIIYHNLSDADALPVIAFYADTNEQAGIFPSIRKCLIDLLGKTTLGFRRKEFIGRFKSNGKPKTTGAKGRRKIYIQYFKGEYKKVNESHPETYLRKTGCKLNAPWSTKNPNFKKMSNEYSKNRARVKAAKRRMV